MGWTAHSGDLVAYLVVASFAPSTLDTWSANRAGWLGAMSDGEKVQHEGVPPLQETTAKKG